MSKLIMARVVGERPQRMRRHIERAQQAAFFRRKHHEQIDRFGFDRIRRESMCQFHHADRAGAVIVRAMPESFSLAPS